MYQIVANDISKDIQSYQVLKHFLKERDGVAKAVLNECYKALTDSSKSRMFGLPISTVNINLKLLAEREDEVYSIMKFSRDDKNREIYSIIQELSSLQIIDEDWAKGSITIQNVFHQTGYENGIIILKLDTKAMDALAYIENEYSDVRVNKEILNESIYAFQLDRYICQARNLGYTNMTVKINDLRSIFNISDDSYTSFYDFERFVLRKSFDYINSLKNIEYEAYYEKEKDGRRIDRIVINTTEKSEEMIEYDNEELAKSIGFDSLDDFIAETGIEEMKLSRSEIRALMESAAAGMKKYRLLSMNRENTSHLIRESKAFADSTKTEDTHIVHLISIVREDRANAMLERYMEALEKQNVKNGAYKERKIEI